MINTLSLCIICKNEENTIPKLLNSITGDLFDEIIITDTGSTDKTLEVLKNYQKDNVFKSFKIEHFKWVDDFSAARNYSFSKATQDYILWLDSDDYVKPEDYQKLIKLKKRLHESPMWLIKYEYAHDEFGNSICSFYRERIVKRSLNLKWQQPIHEYIPLVNYQKMDIEIHHNKSHETSNRNINILEKIVKKNPKDARNIYYLGKEYMDCGKFDQGYTLLKNFIDMDGAWGENIYAALLRMSDYHKAKKEYEKAKDFCYQAIKIDPFKAKVYCYLGELCLTQNQYHQTIHWYKIAANMERSEDSLDIVEPKFYTWLPNLQLCIAYNSLGNVKESAFYNEKALEHRPEDPRMLNNRKIFKEFLKEDYPTYLYKSKLLKDAMSEYEEVTKEPEPLPEFNGKIGWYASEDTTFASNRIRMVNICNQLKFMGYSSELFNSNNEDNYNIIITGKEYRPHHLNKIKEWKSKGITVIADLNEDVLDFPNVKETLKECDYVICCSQKLKYKVYTDVFDHSYLSSILVIEDALDYEEEL